MDMNNTGSMEYLETTDPGIKLVPPNVERDAQLGVEWLAGEDGRETLKLMGVTENNNKPTTLRAEKERVQGFIENTNQLNWMIELNGKVVGSVWLDLVETEYLLSPSIHIMVGDPTARQGGVGAAACSAVIEHIRSKAKFTSMYSRYLTINIGSKKLLSKLGFEVYGDDYVDQDGLRWQNVRLNISK